MAAHPHGETDVDSPSDEQTFLGLIESHRPMLMKVAWTHAYSSHDRDDLVQEMIGRLWSAFPKYDPNRKFSTWMYRVALNVAIDFRRRQRSRPGPSHAFDESLAEPEAAIRDALTKQDQLRDLFELLDQHSDVDRAILLLHLEGNSYSEIGEIIGISASNVGSRLSRLKKSLRASLQSDPPLRPETSSCNSTN